MMAPDAAVDLYSEPRPLLLRLTFWFMLWTLAEYWLHRLMHVSHRLNPLWYVHRLHHAIPLDVLTDAQFSIPKWHYFIWWFDNWHETLEIVIGETIPALLIYALDPECGYYLLIFHYVYELLATDSLLEHNSRISNETIISNFAVGQFHLEHHRRPHKNFGFTISWWDHLFGTFSLPTGGSKPYCTVPSTLPHNAS
jgi:sterol desaturase/sphingolipid hydroxylase (fatty acid hydroxylase superfamily)